MPEKNRIRKLLDATRSAFRRAEKEAQEPRPIAPFVSTLRGEMFRYGKRFGIGAAALYGLVEMSSNNQVEPIPLLAWGVVGILLGIGFGKLEYNRKGSRRQNPPQE